jgi:hypothetical protein
MAIFILARSTLPQLACEYIRDESPQSGQSACNGANALESKSFDIFVDAVQYELLRRINRFEFETPPKRLNIIRRPGAHTFIANPVPLRSASRQ